MDTLTDILSITEQTTYVSGGQYGSLRFYHLSRSKYGVACLVTTRKEIEPLRVEWRSIEVNVEEGTFEKMVSLIKAENTGLVSNYRETDDPQDYQVHYYVYGKVDDTLVSVKIEQVMRPGQFEESHPLFKELWKMSIEATG